MSEAPSSLALRRYSVMAEIADAARVAGRNPEAITTIVVTKFHPASVVRELADLGVRDFGENRHQDAAPKASELSSLSLTWHFIGQLQSNKVRAVLDYAEVIHSVDRESLVSAIELAEHPIDAFIQLNLTDDPNRGGVVPDRLIPLAERVLTGGRVRLRGLMAVAPLGEEPRRAFERVRRASESLQRVVPVAAELSMGMSGDFREAILEGATHLRIGTAITGNRPNGD